MCCNIWILSECRTWYFHFIWWRPSRGHPRARCFHFLSSDVLRMGVPRWNGNMCDLVNAVWLAYLRLNSYLFKSYLVVWIYEICVVFLAIRIQRKPPLKNMNVFGALLENKRFSWETKCLNQIVDDIFMSLSLGTITLSFNHQFTVHLSVCLSCICLSFNNLSSP